MTKQNYSFISTFHKRNIKSAEEAANRRLAELQALLNEHGETLADAIEYQKRGADYKVKAVEDECKKWLAATRTPFYLHFDYLDKARKSLGAEALEYYKKLGGKLTIAFGDDVLNFAKDIAVGALGAWRVAPALVTKQIEAGRVTMTEEDAKDYETFNALRRAFLDFARCGYHTLCEELTASIGKEAAEDYPLQDFCGMYEPTNDTRKK